MLTTGFTAILLSTACVHAAAAAEFDKQVKAYTDAIRSVNEQHARKPGKTREPELAKKLGAGPRDALEKLLRVESAPGLPEGLLRCAEAAADLDLIEDFDRVRARLEKLAPDEAARLGVALSRPRFLLRGLGGLDRPYLEGFAEALEGILAAYDKLFGFEEWSKVPGKKLRVRVHLEKAIERPPHFAPEFPFHSEIDFPVVDAAAFRSPTSDGKFLFYGLCHELGHVIAMWGNARNEEDHHAWAHYTGCVVVEHLAETARDKPWMKNLADARWRSWSAEKKRLESRKPSSADRDGVLALFAGIHNQLGSASLGSAINWLDARDKRLRINRVRYYSFKELKQGLLASVKTPSEKQAVETLFQDAGR